MIESMKKKRIMVVMGGSSTEREVSLRSGAAVSRALKEKDYHVEDFDLTAENAIEMLKKKPDVVFLALHGKGGEDGTIQGMLQLNGIPFTGAGVTCSGICINKIMTKHILCANGIKTPPYLSCNKRLEKDRMRTISKEVLKELGVPVVVKAACQGSSVGVEIVKSAEDILCSIDRVSCYDDEILFEQYIPGVELTVPVFEDNDEIVALPVIEIVSDNSFYDYESKYSSTLSHHIIPARVSASILQEVTDSAKKAYLALNCKGLVRIDFLVDKLENAYVIEVNTIPGMTETSLAPDSARAAGISFEDLCEKLLLSAMKDNIQ